MLDKPTYYWLVSIGFDAKRNQTEFTRFWSRRNFNKYLKSVRTKIRKKMKIVVDRQLENIESMLNEMID